MRLLTYLFVLFLCLSCQQQDAMPIAEYLEIAEPNDQLIDVRTPGEFSAGHLPGARNINIAGEQSTAEFLTLDPEKTVYVYCQKGGRSARAASVLDSLGFRVVDLLGGYGAYAKKQ